MNDRINRIAAFIESLPITPDENGNQSIVMTTDLGAVGEGKNEGDCINADRQQCTKSTNGGNCENTANYCKDSKNGGNCKSGLTDEMGKL